MRTGFLMAVIIGILVMPVYAQYSEPAENDTAMGKVSEPDVMQKMEKPADTEKPEMTKETMSVAPELSLNDMTFCTGVEEREPVSPDSTFSADVGKLYCWSNIKNDGGEAAVQHVWYYNGEEMARVDLPAKFARNRVWSSKNILPEWKGQWKVAVMSGDNKLGEMTCTVE